MTELHAPYPVIIHIPHARLSIPPHARNHLILSDDELADELILMTDRYTDELFDSSLNRVQRLMYPVSRLVIDPERFRDDADEPMATRGMGAIYTRTAHGLPLRLSITETEREVLLVEYYDPHHSELTRLVKNAIHDTGGCLIIDAHSFPSQPLPCDMDQAPNRPDICIGTDGFHTPTSLANNAVAVFEAQGWSVEINRPYSGCIAPLEFYCTDNRAMSIMIEINRKLYMNERTGEKLKRFGGFCATFQRCLDTVIRQAGDYGK